MLLLTSMMQCIGKEQQHHHLRPLLGYWTRRTLGRWTVGWRTVGWRTIGWRTVALAGFGGNPLRMP